MVCFYRVCDGFCGYAIFVKTIIDNRYAFRIIEIYDDHIVIENGLYARVRHPMYSGALMIYLFSPIALGSFMV